MSKLRIAIAFAAVYVIWGSTYLAIRVTVQTIEPFFAAGLRFTVAGTLLYLWRRAAGAARPSRRDWKNASVGAVSLFLVGNGLLFWAERHISSGLTALLIATLPLWIAITGSLWQGTALSRRSWAGLLLGLGGVALLLGPADLTAGERPDPLAAAAILIATVSWAVGSLHARQTSRGIDPILLTAMSMAIGGVLLLATSFAIGEPWLAGLADISRSSALAYLYLVAMGTVAFVAYGWLLHAVEPQKVATYAYVNPVIALLLGWALADEPLTARIAMAAAVIVAAVVLLVSPRRPLRPPQAVRLQWSAGDTETCPSSSTTWSANGQVRASLSSSAPPKL